jgi:hypothetical protein
MALKDWERIFEGQWLAAALCVWSFEQVVCSKNEEDHEGGPARFCWCDGPASMVRE